MRKQLNPEAQEFLTQSIQALQKELKKKESELQQKQQLINYYEMNLISRKVIAEVAQKPQDKYPACSKPLSEINLSY